MSKISRNSSNITVDGHQGTWYVIDSKQINGQEFFLLEHEKYGDETACVIIDDNNDLVLEDVWNGFDDLSEQFESISISAVNQKPRLFVDMDGTLAEFKPVATMETLYEKEYFENLAPMKVTVDAINSIIENHPDIEVFILSAYLSDSEYALREKQRWLDQYLPSIDLNHRIFCPCGSQKRAYVPDGIKPTDVLLDDYTKNLMEWEPPARGIKLLNGINDTRQTWQGARANGNEIDSETLAAEIVSYCHSKEPSLQLTTENEYSKSFISNCLDGNATVLDLDRYLEYWHNNETGRTLPEFLGMTEAEYNAWVQSDDSIFRKILYCRVEKLDFTSYLAEQELLSNPKVQQYVTQAKSNSNVVIPKSDERDRGGNGKVCQAIKEHFDVKEYCERHYGLSFVQKGSQFQCKEHDSMWIDPVRNVFIRNSANVGGSIIDLVMHFEKLDKAAAISKLRLEMGDNPPEFTPSKYAAMKEASEKKTLKMPAKLDKKYSRVFAYLTKKRGIDPDIISNVIKQGVLYEDKSHHNAVFVYKDHTGKPVGGTMRSTGEQKWQLEIEGSEKVGWSCFNNNEKLFLCEAPIDAMSIMTTLKLNNKDYRQFSYLAQGGNPPHGTLKDYMIHNPNTKVVFLCHDNDDAGFKLADKATKELLEAGFTGEIRRKVPNNNDFNQDLQVIRGIITINETNTKNQVQEVSKCLEH